MIEGDGMKGIDIYNGTGVVDFNKVKAAGYDFVMIKSSEGHTLADKSLSRNLTEAAKAGVYTGVYHWFWGRSEEETDLEIDFFLKTIRGCKMKMPVALDVEQAELSKLGKSTLTKLIKRWLDGVKENGYYPIVYANKNWLINYIDMTQLKGYDIWLAQYNTQITYEGAGEIGMWQYSSSAKVPGVKNGTGNCDVNICYKDYPDIIVSNGYNNYPKPITKPDVSWDTLHKDLTIGGSYQALCVIKNTEERASVRTDNPQVVAIERMGPDYTARSGQTGDIYTITGISKGEARIIASIKGDSASFTVNVV